MRTKKKELLQCRKRPEWKDRQTHRKVQRSSGGKPRSRRDIIRIGARAIAETTGETVGKERRTIREKRTISGRIQEEIRKIGAGDRINRRGIRGRIDTRGTVGVIVKTDRVIDTIVNDHRENHNFVQKYNHTI